MDIATVMKRFDASGADELAVLDAERRVLGILSGGTGKSPTRALRRTLTGREDGSRSSSRRTELARGALRNRRPAEL
jgi:hypothetical protein